MKLRKWIVALLSSVMVLSLAACGGANTVEESDKSAESSTEESSVEEADVDESVDVAEEVSEGTITLAIWDKNQEPGLRTIIDDFTAESGIEVTIQVTPWDQYWTMLEAGATGGSLPDMFWMHSNEIAKYSEYEMLLDLTDKINGSDKVDLDKYPAEIIEIYNWEGTQYAMPKDIDTIALWYNKTMFDEAGVGYPDAEWTWEDFKEAAKALTKEDGSQYGYSIRPSNNQDGWYNMVYSMGGEVISGDKKSSGFDKEGTIEALEFVTSIVKEGYTPSYEVMAENNAEALFEAGKVAMVTMGSWMLPELCNNDYVIEHGEIAVLPKNSKTGDRVSIYNGLGWAAAANTDKPEEVWQLIEYLGSEEAQQKQSDLGIVISAHEGTTDNWIGAYPDFNLQAYLDMKENLVIRPYSKTTVRWERMINETLIEAWTGDREVKDVAAEITEKMNETLAEEE